MPPKKKPAASSKAASSKKPAPKKGSNKEGLFVNKLIDGIRKFSSFSIQAKILHEQIE